MYGKIAKNKSLLKEYETADSNRTVYLKDGDEFQIQLFNPETTTISARIWIEDVQLSHDIVLRPGERIWLERYTDKSKKFKFETYIVDDDKETKAAISHNGNIEIQFRRKKSNISYSTLTISDPYNTYWNSLNTSASPICELYNSITASVPTESSTSTISCATNSLETGIIGEGSSSNQNLNTVYMDFEYWPFRTENIKILPESRKPYTSEDLKKIYCSNCGRKMKTKYKYCPYCGNKIN